MPSYLETAADIAREAERILPAVRHSDPLSLPRSRALVVTEAVTLGAARAAEHHDGH